jgi:hypothetical protein
MRRWTVLTIACLVLLGVCVQANAAPTPKPTGTRLMNELTFYPRSLRLEHSGAANGRVLVSVVTDTPSHTGVIFESLDDGRSFTEVGRIPDPWGAAPRGGCCSSIFELPTAIGGMPAGTLLWASSMGRNVGEARLRLWKSNDVGRTWTFVSSPYVAPNGLGVWEPELSIDAAGRLVVHFADETEQPTHSQTLARVVSTDGVTWSAKSPTVKTPTGHYRPGMPVVAELADGSYLMTYEICGMAAPYNCDVRLRRSADGWDWGDPADLGTRPTTVDGKYFTHTPTLTTSPDGRLLLIGQILQDRSGAVSAGNGATMFANTENGSGFWYELPSPVSVPNARDAVCPNYSPTLLPSLDGTRVFELTTAEPPEGGPCAGYFATASSIGSGAVRTLPPAWYRLVNVRAAHCLDIAGGSTQPGANIADWICNDQPPQDFHVEPAGRGVFTLTARNSGHCADVPAGDDVRQTVCDERASQKWRFVNVGRDTYQVVNAVSGRCLDVLGGSEAPGADVVVSPCTNRSQQFWRLERRLA